MWRRVKDNKNQKPSIASSRRLREKQKPENKIFNRHRDRIYIFDSAFHAVKITAISCVAGRFISVSFCRFRNPQHETSIFKKEYFMNIKNIFLYKLHF